MLAKVKPGSVLVANPRLPGPFAGTTILLTRYGKRGAQGLVLNKVVDEI